MYNTMDIQRLELDNKRRYKVEEYRQLQEFYNSKMQQIHIVGEYANMMVKDYSAALIFVNDYFQMDYKLFITKYFKGARLSEIERNITPMKYKMLFENLSAKQTEIINDDDSKGIVVAAGPGSGKTMILVHKLASLMLLEDVKHEQLLMLTFSRASAMEFKQRLVNLIGNAAYFIEIKTFHSYCFDLLGKVGNTENSENVVHDATQMILDGDVELDKITKTVLVLDEAQDMNCDEYSLVRALLERNEDIVPVTKSFGNVFMIRSDSVVITEDMWKNAIAKLVENYTTSNNLSSCIYLLEQYKQTNKKIYYMDAESFLREARFEDFYKGHKGEICVSTIHKAKGREFDNVFLVLNRQGLINDEGKRKIYVGFTRAKNNLYICARTEFYEKIQPLIDKLRSGDALKVIEEESSYGKKICFYGTFDGEDKKIAVCSKKGNEAIFNQCDKGYQISMATVSYVVRWKDKESLEEYSIILPIVKLNKRK